MPAGKRVLNQSISTDPRFSRVPLKAKLLYPLLWVNADDQGRLSGDPAKIKLTVCPAVPEIEVLEIPELLQALQDEHMILCYNTSKAAAIQMLDWWDVHRPQWAWPSEYSPPPGWIDHLRYKKGAQEVVTQNWPTSSGEGSGERSGEGSGEKNPGPADINSSPEASGERSGDVIKRKLKRNINSNSNFLTGEKTRAQQRSLLKLTYYDRLADSRGDPLAIKSVLVSFCRDELHLKVTSQQLYAQVGKMLKTVDNPYDLMSIMLLVWERNEWEPLDDVGSFLWSRVSDKARAPP